MLQMKEMSTHHTCVHGERGEGVQLMGGGVVEGRGCGCYALDDRQCNQTISIIMYVHILVIWNGGQLTRNWSYTPTK